MKKLSNIEIHNAKKKAEKAVKAKAGGIPAGAKDGSEKEKALQTEADKYTIPPQLQAEGWRKYEGKKFPAILYGLVKVEGNYAPVRIEQLKDGSVIALAMPENLKQIAADRILVLMTTEIA